MPAVLGYILELLGFGCLVYAALLVSLPLAIAVFGVGLIVGAQAARR